jgi:hypothetical protein
LAFSVDFLSGISSYLVDSSVFLGICDQIAPLCAGFRAFFEENFPSVFGGACDRKVLRFWTHHHLHLCGFFCFV